MCLFMTHLKIRLASKTPKESPVSDQGSVFEDFSNSSPEESPLSPSALVSKSNLPEKDGNLSLENLDSKTSEVESLGNLDSNSPDLEESRSKELAVKDNSIPDGDSPPRNPPKMGERSGWGLGDSVSHLCQLQPLGNLKGGNSGV